MKVNCAKCNREYKIAADRLPPIENSAFPCPACKGIIEVDPPLQREPKGEALRKKILRTVGDLPAMPQTVLKVRQIMASSTAGFEDLATVLETDQAMVAKVLRLANSPYYGMCGKVSSVQHATVVLGHKTLEEVVIMAGTEDILGNTLGGYDLEAGDLWQHSLAVALGSRIIANKKNPSLANDAFAAGLLHDAGKLVLDHYILERKKAFDEFMADGNNSFLSAEKEILGFDHSEIAFALCESWHVPQTLATAIRHHHYPAQSQGDELTYVVHVADAIAMMTGKGGGVDGMFYQMDDGAMDLLNLKRKDLGYIMQEVIEITEKMVEPRNEA